MSLHPDFARNAPVMVPSGSGARKYSGAAYTRLTDAKAVFRALKSELGLRPIFHRAQARLAIQLGDVKLFDMRIDAWNHLVTPYRRRMQHLEGVRKIFYGHRVSA